MDTKTYFEKLKDPRWQKLRLQTLEAAGWMCAQCCDTESTLHVHHRQYFKGREPWEYEVGQLEVLCEDCHSSEHDGADPLLLVASFVSTNGPFNRDGAASLIAGYCGHELTNSISDPATYLAGRLAQLLDLKYDGLLLDLCEAIAARDRDTVSEALDTFTADLRLRAAAHPRRRGAPL